VNLITSLIAEVAADARNHTGLVSNVADCLNALKQLGLFTG